MAAGPRSADLGVVDRFRGAIVQPGAGPSAIGADHENEKDSEVGSVSVGERSRTRLSPNVVCSKARVGCSVSHSRVKQVATRIDITDMTGKLVATHSISADAILPGNRVTLKQDLAAGTYKAILIQNGLRETKTIVVAK